MVKFDSFSLPEPVLRALSDMGFEDASPIQEAAIPTLLQGGDAIAQAQTGTGKTAAFGIPLVIGAMAGKPALVLVPTRELAQQVTAEIERIGKHAGVKALALYGGASFGEQARALEAGDSLILVATPGRLRDHISRGTLVPSAAKFVVLDEADEMLKMGFVDEVEEILDAVGTDRQTLLFSATMPEPVVRLAEKYLRDPETIIAANDNDSVANANTEQFVVGVDHREKCDALVRLLAVEGPTGVLVFRHTRESVDALVGELRAKGLAAEALHGGMAQNAREDVLERLKRGSSLILVATNVAARGLDVDTISHVVNYDAPRETDAYVHRIGRTGRAGREGKSFLFVTPADRGRLRGIERAIQARLAWREVPSDREVHQAIAARSGKWLNALEMDAPEDKLALIDQAIADGADLRMLAAVLLARVAPHEGFVAPPLEPRRERHAHAGHPAHGHPAPRGHGHMHGHGHGAQRATNGPRVALTITVGRDDGVRPADLVGALTNGGGLIGADVGRIDILPRMSVCEVPEEALPMLFERLDRATIRGCAFQMRVAQRWEFRAPPRAPTAR